jgi:transcriptional regulator with XRE-family HTH domain
MKFEDAIAKFAKRLKLLRQQKGYSGRELARRMGLSSPMVVYYENGTNFPRVDGLVKLCNLLDTTPNELLGYAPLRTSKRKRR